MATKYDVELDDPALKAVKDEEATEIKNSNSLTTNQINQVESGINEQIANLNAYETEQKKIQQEQTEFAIDKIEQQKAQTEKDYQKEQSAAYVDYQKQTNKYGVNAEQMASQGMSGSGYSESSNVSMFNTYQNRVATARASFEQAKVEYNNAITEAKLANNAALAEIAYKTLEKKLELSMTGLTMKNELLNQKYDRELQIKSLYNSKWKDVYDRLYAQKEMEFKVQQHKDSVAADNARLAFEKDKFERTFAAQYGGSNNDDPGGNAPSGDPSGPASKWTNVDKARERAKTNKQAVNASAVVAALKGSKNPSATLKQFGLTMGSPRLLSAIEFTKAKRAGVEGSDINYSGTYSDYVMSYVTWRMGEKGVPFK